MTRVPRPLLPLAALVLAAGLGVWQAREARWRGPLYCIETPGRVWGELPLPRGATPACPESRSYRQEVRGGFSRVEQYRLGGWQPEVLVRPLVAAGYTLHPEVPDDGTQFAAFLRRGGELMQYVADRQPGGSTLITLSGPPR